MGKNGLLYYPMRMKPALKNYIWGGEKLKLFNKQSKDSKIAESWELSCNKAGLTIIDNGIYKGKALKDVIETSWVNFLGKNSSGLNEFPLIIKFIDAQKDLSIQVHPSKETADRCNGEVGKSELWYIIECDQDSYVYFGFKENISKEKFEDSVTKKNVCELLNKIKVRKGQSYYIPAGTIHALGKGILVAEIQQNSNTTFRIYDYDRKDFYGNLRELHIDRAKEVVNLNKTVPNLLMKENFCDFECEYFNVKKELINEDKFFYKGEDTFNVVQFIAGSGEIVYNNINYKGNLGDTFFIPAPIKSYIINGECEVLITKI